jgi:oligopeptide/dipeptide ABC transporter ATP-binding protein
MDKVILDVKNLKKYFDTPNGKLHAVDDVTFSIERGVTLGVVGESGCGKSTLGRTILKLTEPTSGRIMFNGADVAGLTGKDLRLMRREMQIIFQDPFSSLDPRKTVSDIIAEPIRVNAILPRGKQTEARVRELMDIVGLASRLINSYPHELDGGRRQRIGIARALAMNPKLIICDEPVSALDVSIQAQILNLMKQLKKDLGLTYIFISHDLAVVHNLSDEIAVMYLGRVVEKAHADELFNNPLHPYTRALLSAIPVAELSGRRERIILRGEITSPIEPPDECRFSKRCFKVCDKCRQKEPQLEEQAPNHYVSCFFAGDKEE